MDTPDTPLTGKQKRLLKSIGQRMGDDLRVGKEGLSDRFIATLNEALRRQEVVKLRFADMHGQERKLFAKEVAQAVNAECVSVVGMTTLLYRANPELEERVLDPLEDDEAEEAEDSTGA